MGQGRVVLGADLFNHGAQQGLSVVGDGKDGGQLHRRVAQGRHHRCKEPTAGGLKVCFLDILNTEKKLTQWHHCTETTEKLLRKELSSFTVINKNNLENSFSMNLHYLPS